MPPISPVPPPAPPPPASPPHPVRTNRGLEQRVREVIYAEIHRNLGWPRKGADRALEGTGISVDDIAAEAFTAVWYYNPVKLRGSWESLARRIARNKTVAAVRATGKGLTGTEHRPPLQLVHGDAETTSPEGVPRSALTAIISQDGDLEEDTIAMLNGQALFKLARDIFDYREFKIFVAVVAEGRSYVDIGKEWSLTGARIGQIHNGLQDRLMNHPDNPFLTDD